MVGGSKPGHIARALLIVGLIVLPACHEAGHTATQEFWTYAQSNPHIVFTRQANDNSTLAAYASYGNERYRIVMRAGSGISTDDCAPDEGWLPAGSYNSPNFMYKTEGSAVVRGYVWHLPDRVCSAGTVLRFALFIHSSGIEGTAWNGNYNSEGCIKISQLDRYADGHASLRPFLRSAYNRDSETMTVTGP